LLAAITATPAPADPPGSKPKPKASSFAPHHTTNHVYGAPVGKPILHKHKKPARAAQPADAAAPIK
jgi:hypothetical protein